MEFGYHRSMIGTTDLNQFLIFVRVIQAGSLSGATRRLNLPKSIASIKTSAPEERIGEWLIQHTTRKLSLDVGRILFKRVSRSIEKKASATRPAAGLGSHVVQYA